MKALTYIEQVKFALIEAGKIDTTPLITHRYKLEDIEEAFQITTRVPNIIAIG